MIPAPNPDILNSKNCIAERIVHLAGTRLENNQTKIALSIQLQQPVRAVVCALAYLRRHHRRGLRFGRRRLSSQHRLGHRHPPEPRLADFLLPFAGLLIVFTYRRAGLAQDPGTNLVLASIQSKQHIPIRMAPLIFFGTIITHLCGGSSGREGAALQIGGSIGEALGRLFRLRDTDINIIVICGMSAVFASLFGTPIAATVFSMEVISVGVIHYSAFVPCIVSASIAYGIIQTCGIGGTAFPQIYPPELSVFLFLKVILLAMVCGVVSILFCVVIHQAGHLYKKLLPNDYGRIFAGGCLVAALTLLTGTRAYNGQGSDMLLLSMTGTCPTFAFLLKIVFTALTLGAGFKGGEIVPALFCSALPWAT